MPTTTKIILVLLVILVAGLGWALYQVGSHPIIFSEQAMIDQLWVAYKNEYLEPGTGRTMDKQRQNITTSEGEAYTLLRAVWTDDKATFDQSWQWTKDNLQRDDYLFAWLFGERSNGSFGIITSQSGNNTASDADTDIALALLFAYSRWQDPHYFEEATRIIPNIWEAEVVTLNNRPYLVANNIEKNSTKATILINPSYFAPYAYRIFSTIDAGHPWLALVTNSYDLLDQSLSLPLDKKSSVGLPPDWFTINRQTGALAASLNSNLTTNYGYDAMRIPWRLALDYNWFGEPRAKNTLSKLEFLATEWQAQHRLASTYTHDGTPILTAESPAMYGGALGFFLLIHPEDAVKIYQQKLLTLYNPDTIKWKEALGYYDDNLAWFGMALAAKDLANLYDSQLRKNSFGRASLLLSTSTYTL